MSVIFLLIPLSVLIAAGFLWAFFWAVRSGQFEDTTTPSLRPLLDDISTREPSRKERPDSHDTSATTNHGKRNARDV